MRILLNSNGLRIAQDDQLVATLKKHRERVEVYLQYDGESAEASAYHPADADIRRLQGARPGAAVGCRCVHHPHDDGRARGQRRLRSAR
ncbi:MAG: hypothetical protein R2692_05565 [Microbacterium sp.]